jgi:hypothetical protein
VTATTYFWPRDPVNHFSFAYSSDNLSFTPIAPTLSDKGLSDKGGDWHKFVYEVSVPAGTNYVRVIFPTSSKYWTPQLGQVVLSTAPTAPTQTPTPVASGPLDNFNRPGPELGANWAGNGPTLSANQFVGNANIPVYWQQSFGADQRVSVKINQLLGCNSVSLLLKATGNTHANGLVMVSYNRCASPQIILYAYNTIWKGWAPFKGGNPADSTFNPGDVLSARVQANRVVSVYYNGNLIVSDVLNISNVGFDVARAGQIGLSASSSAVVLDDFDGGSVSRE